MYRECATSLCPTSNFILSPCPMANTVSHMFKLYFEQFREIFFFIWPGSADHASCNKFWRASGHLGSSSKWIIRPKLFRTQLSLDEIFASKRGVNKIIRGNNVGEAKSDQALKKAGEPAFAFSAFCEHYFESKKFNQPSWFLAAASHFPRFKGPLHNY